MNNYKKDFQKLSDLEKKAIEEKEELIKRILYEYEHKDIELSQEKRKVTNLKLREMEHLEFIESLRKDIERLNKELKNANKQSISYYKGLSSEEIDRIQQVHKKQVDELVGKIKTLQDKLGNKTVHLSTLAEGIKSYAEETTIEKAHNFFEALNSILIGEKAWVDNAKQLKKYFQELNKKKKGIGTFIGHAGQVIGIAEKDSTVIQTNGDKDEF